MSTDIQNSKNSSNSSNIQKDLLENQLEELDKENFQKVQQILEMSDDMIEKGVNNSYQNLLKQNSFENIHWFRKQANPEKLKKELTEKVIENIEEEDEKTNIIMEFVKKSQNKFILSQEKLQALTDKELNKLLFEVGQLLDRYQYASKEDRKKLRQQNPLPKFSDFPENVRDAIKSKLSDKNSVFESQGAENVNQGKLNADVYKLTKGRHDSDYFSILQLVKYMIALEKDFRDENKKLEQAGKKVKIRNANEAVIFYEDEKGNYKRLIKQSFAPGESVDVALKKVLNKVQWEYLKKNPEKNCIGPSSKCKYKKLINLDNKLDDILPEDFNTLLYDKNVSESDKALFQAYKDFLQSIQNISDEKGYLLDISDSRQGGSVKRGNILNTSNVFVREENGEFIFTVIDPDVFNKDGKTKFEGKEQEEIILEKEIKSKKVLGFIDKFKAKIKGVLTEVINFARDGLDNNIENKGFIKERISKVAVAPKQEMYMNKILEEKEYNLEVDEKLKNDLIFWTNLSRLAFRRYKKVNGEIVPLSDDEIVDNEKKYRDSIENLKEIGREVKIIDFYPKNKKEEKSGFAGIYAEINGEKYFILKGTKKEKKHKKDKLGAVIGYKPKDIKADIALAFKNVPVEQTKSMIDFFESLNLPKDEKINILGNSLGGALGQIMMKMYPDRFKTGIFPHSPGASDLSININKNENKKYKDKFEQYKKTKKVDADLIYIDGENPIRPISGFGKKLESKNNTKQYSVSGWKLHFMPQLIEFMKNLEYGDMVKVREKSKKNNRII